MGHVQVAWRRALALDLGLYNIAVMVFAWLPPENIDFNEYTAIVASFFAAIGVSARAIPRVKLPGEGWSYLLTGAIGVYVFMAYAFTSLSPDYIKIPFLVFLLSGIASAYAAHVIDGGKEK